MAHNFKKLALLALVSISILFAVGCSQKNVIVDPQTDDADTPLALDYRDFEHAAYQAIDSMLKSGTLDKPGGGRYVMAVSRITNDTMQRIDTDQLVKKIRVALLQSGKVVTTTAVGLNGAEDQMVDKAREVRDSEEFDEQTKIAKQQLKTPEYSLSGKILQRNIRQSKKTQQVEYYFQLSLTDLRTGLAEWEGETPIIKRGATDSVAW